MKITNPLLNAVLAALPIMVSAQDAAPPPSTAPSREEQSAEIVTIRMKDGSSIRARVIDADASRLKIVTAGGVAMELPRASVEALAPAARQEFEPRPSDSNCTRLLFSPTGRPLGKGEGYFSDHYVVFPGVAYGLTDNLSVGGGLSVVPGLGFRDQLYYGTARVGKQFSERVAVSGGALFARGGEGDTDTLGLGFAVATLGRPDRSLTLGLGVARTVSEEYYPEYARGEWQGNFRNRASYTPVVMIGGTARVSRRLALVSENWLILGETFRLSEQPFAVGVRFLGDRLTADAGLIVVGEVIKEGFPVPWLSVSYHFGPKK